MNTCPTVRIEVDEKGYEAGVIINESDFDPKTMKLWVAPVKKRGKK